MRPGCAYYASQITLDISREKKLNEANETGRDLINPPQWQLKRNSNRCDRKLVSTESPSRVSGKTRSCTRSGSWGGNAYWIWWRACHPSCEIRDNLVELSSSHFPTLYVLKWLRRVETGWELACFTYAVENVRGSDSPSGLRYFTRGIFGYPAEPARWVWFDPRHGLFRWVSTRESLFGKSDDGRVSVSLKCMVMYDPSLSICIAVSLG